MTPPRGPEPSGSALATALRSLAGALEQAPGDAPDQTVREVVELLAVVSGRIDAALARLAGVFDARSLWAGDGARTSGAWMAGRTELSGTRSRAAVATARDLRSCPHVEAAWEQGRIGTAKVRSLLSARAAHPELFAQHEEELVGHIEPLTVAHAALAVARWQALAEATREAAARAGGASTDPDAAAPPEDPADDNRFHLSRTLDGRWQGNLDLDPVTGAQLAEAIAARIDHHFNAGTYAADDGRSRPRRQAEALAELVGLGATPGCTKHGDPRPSVSLIIDHRTLAGVPADGLADGLRRRCDIVTEGSHRGTPVGPATAERLLCTARIHALLVRIGEGGEVETLGVTDVLRDATRAQRRALKLRDGGCAFPGCPAPPDWCQAHHLDPHELGGPTLIHNLVLLCSHHHHLVHEGGWRLWRHADGELYLARPDHTLVEVRKHGHKTSSRSPDGSPPVPPPLPPTLRFRPSAPSG